MHARAALTSAADPVLNSYNEWCRSSGGQTSKVVVLAGLVPSEGYEGDLSARPAVADFEAKYGIPWPLDASPHSLPSS